MKKNLLILTLLGILILPLLSSAAFELPIGTGPTITNLIGNILNAVWIIFIGLAILFFIFAGIMFITAQGKPEGIERAKNAVVFGVLGIIVAVIAFSIVTIINTALL